MRGHFVKGAIKTGRTLFCGWMNVSEVFAIYFFQGDGHAFQSCVSTANWLRRKGWEGSCHKLSTAPGTHEDIISVRCLPELVPSHQKHLMSCVTLRTFTTTSEAQLPLLQKEIHHHPASKSLWERKNARSPLPGWLSHPQPPLPIWQKLARKCSWYKITFCATFSKKICLLFVPGNRHFLLR